MHRIEGSFRGYCGSDEGVLGSLSRGCSLVKVWSRVVDVVGQSDGPGLLVMLLLSFRSKKEKEASRGFKVK